jgi:hypothetical protein
MRMTEVHIAFAKPRKGLITFASLVLNNQFYLGGIADHRKLIGSRITFDRPDSQGRQHTVHPIPCDRADRSRKGEGCIE